MHPAALHSPGNSALHYRADHPSRRLPGGVLAHRQIAFVRNVRRVPEIYLTVNDPANANPDARLLTAGTEPDWQPVAPFPPA